MKFRPFSEARQSVHDLRLKSQREWKEFCKAGKKSANIPGRPEVVYQSDWRGWGDWLGTNRVADQNKVFRHFAKAREFVHGLGLKSSTEWRTYSKSGGRPDDIPCTPDKVYQSDWRGWGDWLGNGKIAPIKRKYLPFDAAKEYARSLDIRTQSEWNTFCKSGKPNEIPSDPRKPYKNKWKGWGDWLGTGYVANRNRRYRSFEEAVNFVRKLGIKSRLEWVKYSKSREKPSDIPTQPRGIYKENWKGWGDWLGHWIRGQF